MSALLLLPGIISLFLVLRGRIETAFLSVYLPALLFFPESYALRLPHLPPTSAAEFALIPIGAVALYRFLQSRSFALMDAFVLLFIGSVAISEVLREQILNNAIFTAMNSFISVALAYFVGRQLIEPELRIATVRRIVVLILLLGPLGLFEWRMGQNIYGIIGDRILRIATVPQSVQLRGAHGRMGASFTDAEIAGIAFAMTFALNAWLIYLNKLPGRADLGKLLTKLEKFRVPELLLLAYLWLTQSRGPQLALGAGLLILVIPRFKNAKLASGVAGALLLAAAIGAFAYFTQYTNISNTSEINELQGSALYRRQMNEMYAPVADQGGWFGWGLVGIPHIPGLMSIDNHFLLVHLAQGKLGYILFVLITAENIRTLVARSWRFHAFEDRTFAFCILGAMAILWISLLTVYMGEQLPQFAFLLIGWSQAIVPGKLAAASLAEADTPPKFAFRRVFG